MQILLNTDSYVDGREAMHEHLEAVVQEVLGQYGDRITRVHAYLADANGAIQGAVRDICCTLETWLVEHEPVVARHHAVTANQAIHGALRKLGCVLASEFEKQDHRYAQPAHHHQPSPEQASQVSARMTH
jgi:hypothetical protein